MAAGIAAALALPADGATVTAAYQGVIARSSGLGLMGETMTVRFAYDDAAVPLGTFRDENAYYTDFLQSMQIEIGSNVWELDYSVGSGAGPGLFVYDNSTGSSATAVEDIFMVSAGMFSGPSLVAEPESRSSFFFFSLVLADVTPLGNPDGIDGIVPLPSVAPDPGLFNNDDGRNVMTFGFYTGPTPGFGDRVYTIVTSDVTAVPEPATTGLLALGLAVVGVGAHRMSRTRPAGRA
jgi:hypothetical protein